MNIDKAIEILAYWENDVHKWNRSDTDDAVRLGREALRRLRTLRLYNIGAAIDSLPGETET